MTLRFSLILFLLSCSALAGGLPTVPSPKDLPILNAMLVNHPRYEEAARKAQEAFFIQVGVNEQYDLIKKYTTDRVQRVAKQAEHTTAVIIDDYTPLSSKSVFFLVGACYTVGVKKYISKEFRNPVFDNINHTTSYDFRNHNATTEVRYAIKF